MGVEANQRIGDYEILNELGAGGMGKVYRVRNVISDRIEAMKVLLPNLAGTPELAARFLREIKLLASLSHPNIATLCTALTIDNQLFMIMEFVEGVTLAQLLDRGQVSIADATNYIGQALDALSYAHGKGVIHRDIKPANMMLTADGVVKVMDFGIARSASERSMTQTGTTLGSINYMPPEQITGQGVDARSDIYSVGISLYEIVTGQRPFDANSDYELMAMHVKAAPRPPIELQPSLPGPLNQIILKAIAKDPNDRFQTAADFRQRLREAQGLIDTNQITAPIRQATFVEVVRPATVIDAPGREKTQISGWSPVNQAQQAALANRPPAVPARRKIYIAGGAFFAVAALASPVVYMATHHTAPATTPAVAAAPTPAPASTPATPSAAKPTAAPPAVVANPSVPVKPPAGNAALEAKLNAGPLSGSAAVKTRPAGPTAQPAVGPPAPAPAQPPAISPELQDRLDHLELRIDQDTSEGNSINSSLNTMQGQMQRDGMSLRGDIAAQQSSMNLNLNKAQRALESHDVDRAERFAGLAESDIVQLKKFLGR